MHISDHLVGLYRQRGGETERGYGDTMCNVLVHARGQQRGGNIFNKRPRDIHPSQRVFIHPSHTLKSSPNVTLRG